MSLSARVLANRRNARRSTGPRSSEGKSRVAKNALRHGLAIPVTIDPAHADAAERLARIISGHDVDPVRLEGARRVAEAQIDLLRVRRARVALLNDSKARVMLPTKREVKRELKLLPKDEISIDRKMDEFAYLMNGLSRSGDQVSLEEGFEVLAVELARLDRYERRALSRRKFAIRDFDAACRELSSR
jgi:hypothetical protein